jgi:DNA-binding NtrC family response regulator
MSAILNQKTNVTLHVDALEKIKNWSWPGNARELENVLERAVLISQSSEIRPEDILIDRQNEVEQSHKPSAFEIAMQAGMTIAEMERQLIYKTLSETKQNRTQAAKILGISIRTLRNKLHEYEPSTGQDIKGVSHV